jgi:tetratricopeptide (TPR) repeat protein
MRRRRLTICLLAFLAAAGVFSVPRVNAQDLNAFQEGVNAFQQSQWDQAKEKFTLLLKEDRWRFAALYNLGNIAVRQNRPGLALAYYRLALKISPRDGDLRHNLNFVQNQTGLRKLPGTLSSYEIFRSEFLNKVTFDELLGITLLSLIGFGWVVTGFLKKRKVFKSVDGATRPGLSPLLFVWGILFIGAFALSGLKFAESLSVRATVVVAKAELKSGPGETNATMSELPEGAEVRVREAVNDWKQVTYPGGLTGWVPDATVMITSGGGPW